MEPYITSYAQNREDVLIGGFLKDVERGFYVDVGASDPTHLSVTKYFYDKGWSGINIEPIPDLYKKLVKARPRDINLAIGVGEKRSESKLHYYPQGDGLSTFSNDMANEHKDKQIKVTQNEKVLTVQILPIKEVLEKYAKGKVINFMKIDVEGYEAQVIKGNDWAKYRPQLICIEVEHIFDEWERELLAYKYQKVFFDGLNSYYLAEEVANKAKEFSYVDAILEKPVVYYSIADRLKDDKRRLIELENTLPKYGALLALENQKEQIIAQRDLEIQNLNFEINRPRSIKQAVRVLARSIHYRILSLIECLKPTAGIYIPSDKKISAEELLKEIRNYDKENEIILNTGFNIRSLPYAFVSGVYGLFVRAGKKAERELKQSIRGGNK